MNTTYFIINELRNISLLGNFFKKKKSILRENRENPFLGSMTIFKENEVSDDRIEYNLFYGR